MDYKGNLVVSFCYFFIFVFIYLFYLSSFYNDVEEIIFLGLRKKKVKMSIIVFLVIVNILVGEELVEDYCRKCS